MRIILILIILISETNFCFRESEAKQHSDLSSENNGIKAAERKKSKPIAGPLREVTAQKGGTAILPCKYSEPEGETVTWVRTRDKQLLTVGTYTHTTDRRFMIKNSNTDWSLVIRRVTLEDAGDYECQIKTYPDQILNFARLKVTEAYSIIPGGPDLYVKQGSSLKLDCQLINATEPPNFVFWYQEGRMINYDADPLNPIKVDITKNGSILEVVKTKMSHQGNYTCAPGNAKWSSVMIHVIEEEEKPAAMHGGDRRNPSPAILASNFLASFLAGGTFLSWRIPTFQTLYPT